MPSETPDLWLKSHLRALEHGENLAWQLFTSHAAAMPLEIAVHKNYAKSHMKKIKDASRIRRIPLGLAQVC